MMTIKVTDIDAPILLQTVRQVLMREIAENWAVLQHINENKAKSVNLSFHIMYTLELPASEAAKVLGDAMDKLGEQLN